MKTQAAVLLLGTALLLFVCVLRTTGGVGRPAGWIGRVLLAFVSMQVLLFAALEAVGGGRDTSFGRVVAGADPLPGRLSLVLLGSSYTARNVDGELLQRVLARGGVDVDVVQLSLPGGYAFEQDYYVSRYLRGRSRNMVVFAELGTEQAWHIPPENLRKHDTIGYHDVLRVRDKIAVGVSGTDPDIGAMFEVFKHGLAHYTHLGLVHAHFIGERQEVRAGFSPEPASSVAVPLADILAGLSAADAEVDLPGVFPDYARQRAAAWTALGADKVLFWQPPHVDPERRGWTGRLCSALRESCLPFNGADRMAGAFWNDKGHLTDEGARRYTEWLGQKLLERKDFFGVI